MVPPLLLVVAGIALLIASIHDFRTREVPDLISFGLIALGLGIRLILSFSQGWQLFIQGVVGLGVMVALGYLLFHTAQVGGGDAKLLMGLGAVFGLEGNIHSFLLGFLIN